MSRSRIPSLLGWACVLATACTGDVGPTDAGRAVPLDLRPSYQVDPALFPAAPVDRILLEARSVAGGTVVGTADVAVDPAASQWTLGLAIALGGAASMDVLVDVQLLGGQVAQWSGRLGPITVRAGETPRAQNVPLHRGPLDNLDVVALTVPGAPSQVAVGSSTVLASSLTLRSGSTASPAIFWASTNPAVATVTGQGPTATLTAISAGTTRIVVVAGPVSVELDVEVRSVAPPGFDIEWRGLTTGWSAASNWSLGRVPGASDRVYIPPSSVQPTLSQAAEVGALTVAAGATLTLSSADLRVHGNLAADGTISGDFRVIMDASGSTVRGSVLSVLEITSAVAASGPLSVGSLEITGAGAVFDVGGQLVDVTNEVATLSGGALRMAGAGGRINTMDATFDGGSTLGLLTAGELHVRGSFQTGVPALAFAAGGSHRVVFDGTTPQHVDIRYPDPTEHRFHHVTFSNPTGVTFTSDMVATGLVTVSAGSVLLDDYELAVGGGISDPNGGLLYSGLRLIGPVTTLPRTILASTFVDAAVTWPVDATVAGDITINGSLDVGTHTLRPTGNVYLDGTLIVPTGGALYAGGYLQLGAGRSLQVDGVITAGGGCIDNGASISGTGQHPCGQQAFSRTWIGGAAGAPTDWHNPANWSPAGVPGPSDVVGTPGSAVIVLSQDAAVASLALGWYSNVDLAGHTLTVSGDLDAEQSALSNGLTRVAGPGSELRGFFEDLELAHDRALSGALYVQGYLTLQDVALIVNGQVTTVGSDLSVSGPGARLEMTSLADYVYVGGGAHFDGASHEGVLTDGVLVVEGDLTVRARSATGFASTGNHTLYLGGTVAQSINFALPGATQQRIADLVVASSTATTFHTDAVVTGDVIVIGVWVLPAASTVSIDGSLTLDQGSTLDVSGTVTATGGCTNYGATIRGAGSHPCGSQANYDRTWIGGDAGGATSWHNPANWQPSGVPTATQSVHVPFTNYPPVLASIAVARTLTVANGASIDLNGLTLTVDGDVLVDGFVDNGVLEAAGQGSRLYGSFDRLLISQAVQLAGYTDLLGNIQINAPLTIGQMNLYVAGDLSVGTSQGLLVMVDPAGWISVDGDLTFDGGSTQGLLLAGGIYFTGNLTVRSTHSPNSLVATGVGFWPSGSNVQTFSFSFPGNGGQSLGDLWIFKTGGAVVLESGMLVNGSLNASGATIARGQVAAASVEVRGALSLSQTTFSGVPLRLASWVQPSAHAMSGVTFTNMPTTGAQLYVELQGLGSSVPFLLQSPVFQTTPAQGGYYIEAFNTSPTGDLLEIRVQNGSPTSPGNFTTWSGRPTSILWPWP